MSAGNGSAEGTSSGNTGPDETRAEDVPFGPLSYGSAPLGNMYRTVTDDEAQAALQAGWDAGIRYFDTAPHYGLGLAEHRLGDFLRTKPRDEFLVSTKVGRVLVPNPDYDGGGDLDAVFHVSGTHVRAFDPSEAGVRRSLEDSLTRMGLDRVDILYLHDPDVFDLDRGLREGLPALAKLRDEGLVGRIGIGVNDPSVAARAVREGDLDLVLIAGRYTLLEQTAADELFPLCSERGVRIVSAAPFNSGLLATDIPPADAHYDYQQAPASIIKRARELAEVCSSFGVDLPTAALRFPGRNPVVSTVLVGMGTADEARQNAERMSAPVPEALWDALGV